MISYFSVMKSRVISACMCKTMIGFSTFSAFIFMIGHSPQASSVTTVTGHHVVNITVQGSATFQAPIADNRPTSLRHRQPEDHTGSNSKTDAKRELSVPEQETDD